MKGTIDRVACELELCEEDVVAQPVGKDTRDVVLRYVDVSEEEVNAIIPAYS